MRPDRCPPISRTASDQIPRFCASAKRPPDDRLSSPGFAGFVVVAATTGCGRVRLREAARCDIEAAETAGQAILARSHTGVCEEDLVPHLDAVVIHCRQPAALAGFYAEVLGLPVAPADVAAIEAGTLGPDESVLLGSRGALHVWLTPVRALEPVPGRVHLDVRLGVHGDLDRLIALGATRQWEDPKGRWTVLADPEGNLFCAMHPAT